MSLAGKKTWVSVARKNIVDPLELAFQMGVVFSFSINILCAIWDVYVLFFIINLDSHLIEASCIFYLQSLASPVCIQVPEGPEELNSHLTLFSLHL